ncbi:hypothetical protein JTE90_007960 [Oedothorax gibbosus]|uniref:non-specific serine/threonine protein kinase n=1 Tax=Oedothorax gibbosus TaxID=931172 RepID=A0AAV6U6R2_9ARAC|nr:hypothetical protein JTE90_007960 [Oedothorax gibbosus]
MDRYDKDKIIGSGTFGNVYIIKSKLSRQAYVLKEVGLNSLSETEQQQALNEVSVLAKCKHKHIVRYKEAELDHDNKVLSIVMEYADGGDLFAAIQKQNGVPFSDHRVIKWFIEISLALQYIHHKNILHRDLKSQNVFLTKSKVIKIGDFGISRVLKGPEELAKTAIGTPYYISPEICQRKPYNYKSDIWALGCLLFEMATLEHAFQAQDFFHLVTLIIKGKRKDLPRRCGNLIRDLVSSLLKVDPDERPSTGEILSFPSLQSYLSEYMIDENVCESTLMNTMELNKRKGFHIFKDGVKRRASFSYLNPKESKQRTPLRVEPANIEPPIPRSNTNVRIESLKKLPRPIPQTKAQILRQKKHHVTYRSQSTKVPVQKDQSTQSSFTVSCETYNLLPSTSTTRSCLTKSEDSTLEANCGFHAKEHSILTPTNSLASTLSKIFSFSKFRRHSDDSKVVASPENPLRNISSGFIDSYDSSREGSMHHHCRHSQCYQCVLGIMWRNRIRSKARGSVDSDEYLELKEKLLMVFKKDLFNKVYESLMYDWELTHVNASNVFQGILSSLTYEQVQSLPLMMQLIQLDLLTRKKPACLSN